MEELSSCLAMLVIRADMRSVSFVVFFYSACELLFSDKCLNPYVLALAAYEQTLLAGN